MTTLTWDKAGERLFETGVDHGVLYIPDASGAYVDGYAWNGLTTVTESPSGAESNPQYADNIKYLNLVSAEEFGGTIEAFTYPAEFEQCDGTATPTPGVGIGQQSRKTFGLSYRTKVGNDLAGQDHGYKLHLVYGALAAPSEKAFATINDSPEAITFSWEFTTTPVEVGTIAGVTYKPTANLVIDSTKVDAEALATLEEFLYGTEGTDPSLPTPAAVVAIFSGTVLEATPTEPTYDDATNTLTIPSVTGVTYYIDGEAQTAGPQVLTENKIVEARPNKGYKFPSNVDVDWAKGDF
ncbi:major tail protein [Streptomyces phage Kardashian]|nr:major tail protein [Streptomyces phage Kardashian]